MVTVIKSSIGRLWRKTQYYSLPTQKEMLQSFECRGTMISIRLNMMGCLSLMAQGS